LAAVGLLTVVLAAGCSSAIAGSPMKVGAASTVTPTTAAPVAQGPNGLKQGVADPDIKVTADAHTQYDDLAKKTVVDLYDYYTGIFPTDFGQQFTKAKELISYDSQKDSTACGLSLKDRVNASYMSTCDTIVWDRGVLMPTMTKEVGELAVPTVLAHEMGHLVQARLKAPRTSVLTLEQQADCYAGSYWRWVHDGNSKYFDLSSDEGLRDTITAIMWVGDPVGLPPDNDGAHGSAFDRSFAFSLGYTNGAKRCNEIDDAEVQARIKQTGFTVLPKDFGNVAISPDFVTKVTATLDEYFAANIPGYAKPKLAAYDGNSPPACAGTTPKFPVDYCPATNTVSYNLAELERLGTPTAGWASTNGDFSAMLLLATRYGLAAQAIGGASAAGDQAGLRALCYAGTWATWLRKPQGADHLSLSPNDLNKAAYQVISSPLPATDVNGNTSTTVIDQIQALQIGVNYTIKQCYDFYSS
jgi:predicted metalloprotease